jgi:hypothetical protein
VDADRRAVWTKPRTRPRWLSAAEYAALPAAIAVRVLRYRVDTPGFRVREVTPVTTLLEATSYPAEALADLYYRRWQVEVNFKHMKIAMNMDVLRCKTVVGVLKELAMFAPAYNLVRAVMAGSGRARGVAPERISFLDPRRVAVAPRSGCGRGRHGVDAMVLRVNPRRPGRVEPRVVKRRPKQYFRMTKPRAVLRKELPHNKM